MTTGTKATRKQIKHYLANPDKCLYCGSSNINAEPVTDESQRVTCENCDMEWFDILKLIGIEEVI